MPGPSRLAARISGWVTPLFFALLLAADASQAPALLQRGLNALRQGNLPEARQSLEEASRLDAKNPYAWTSLAEVYFRLKEPAKASAAARIAEKLDGRNPVVCHALAMYYSEAGEYASAARFEETFAQSPQADPGALTRAAGLYMNAGDAAHALPLAQQAAAKNATPLSEDLLGRALIATGNNVEGTRHLARAWEGAKTDPRIAFDFAEASLKAGDFTRAADAAAAALAGNPNDAQLTLALGVARYGQRRFEDAIVEFLKVIRIDPRIDRPYLFLSRMLDQAGAHLEEIVRDDEAWAARNPQNSKAQLALAMALLAANNKDARAEDLLRRSVALDANDWESHYQLGVVLETKHEYAKAAEELNKSVALDGKQPMPHYHLARVYDRLGERDRAAAEREIHQRLTGPRGP